MARITRTKQRHPGARRSRGYRRGGPGEASPGEPAGPETRSTSGGQNRV